jgi:hypothetical protein
MFYEGYGQGSAPEQWKGAIWPPMNATVYDGLKRYGFDEVAGEFAARSTAIYLGHLGQGQLVRRIVRSGAWPVDHGLRRRHRVAHLLVVERDGGDQPA